MDPSQPKKPKIDNDDEAASDNQSVNETPDSSVQEVAMDLAIPSTSSGIRGSSPPPRPGPARIRRRRRRCRPRRRSPVMKICSHCKQHVTTPYTENWAKLPPNIKERWLCHSCREYDFDDEFLKVEDLARLSPAMRKELEMLDMYESMANLEERMTSKVCFIIFLFSVFFTFVFFCVMLSILYRALFFDNFPYREFKK